jgi:hypothetical protein
VTKDNELSFSLRWERCDRLRVKGNALLEGGREEMEDWPNQEFEGKSKWTESGLSGCSLRSGLTTFHLRWDARKSASTPFIDLQILT